MWLPAMLFPAPFAISYTEIQLLYLEEALIKVLSSKIKTPDQMAKDKTVIDKVLSDENNRDYIIQGYLDQINGQNAPVVMPDGGEMPMVKPYKPSSIKEAGELAKMIIKKL